MHRHHAMLAEPWDGPAGLVFSDGVVCGAALDRNGLRPRADRRLRRRLVAARAEAGAEAPARRRHRPSGAAHGPGQLLSIDPERGLLFDGELKRDLASRKPYGEHGSRKRPSDQGAALQALAADPAARHALHGYTREELSLMLRPIAQTGADPRLLDGRRRADRAARRSCPPARVVLPRSGSRR